MKVGDEVRIKKDSVYYTLNGNSNPKVNGVITDIRENKQYCFKVLWNNKKTNNYRITDLEIVEYKPTTLKDNGIFSTSKPKRYETGGIDVIDICKLYDLNFNLGNNS